MTMQAAREIEKFLPATHTAPGLSEAEFLKLCAKFPDAMVEYTSDGRVIVMPLKDPESGAQGAAVAGQLGNWASEHGKGHVCGPDAGFRFRDGSRRSPDAAWFDDTRWRAAKKPRMRFPVFVTIYGAAKPPRVLENPATVAGE
jgi:Uma2 family endonuclease